MSDTTQNQNACDHGISFTEEDRQEAERLNMSTAEIRRRWPRLFGPCPKGCGFNGIAYASRAHYVYGEW